MAKIETEDKRKLNYSISIEVGAIAELDKIVKEKENKNRSSVINKLVKKYNLKHGIPKIN